MAPIKFTIANYVVLLLPISGIVALRILQHGFDAYHLARTMGVITAIVVIPYVIAVMVWLISRKKNTAAVITFNIIFFLGIMAQMKDSGAETSVKKAVIEMQKASYDYQKKKNENPDSVDVYYKEFSARVQNSMDELLKTSNDDAREGYLFLKEFIQKAALTSKNFSEAKNKMLDTTILNFPYIYEHRNYDTQFEVIEGYIAASKENKDFTLNMHSNLNEKFKELDENDPTVKAIKEGFLEEYDASISILEPHINAHISVGQDYLHLLRLLEQAHGKWYLENGYPIFEETHRQPYFDSVLNQAAEKEAIVDSLYHIQMEL